MNWIITVYIAFVFFILTPGIIVSFPPKRGKFTVAAVHALLFAFIWHVTHKFVWQMSMSLTEPTKHEGFTKGANAGANGTGLNANVDPVVRELARKRALDKVHTLEKCKQFYGKKYNDQWDAATRKCKVSN